MSGTHVAGPDYMSHVCLIRSLNLVHSCVQYCSRTELMLYSKNPNLMWTLPHFFVIIQSCLSNEFLSPHDSSAV